MKEFSEHAGKQNSLERSGIIGRAEEQTSIREGNESRGRLFDKITQVFPRKEKDDPLPRPERFRIVDPAVEKFGKVEVIEGLDREKFDFPPERRKTIERKNQLIDMRHALVSFGKKELGVDLSRSVPDKRKFHFFDEATYRQAMESIGVPSIGESGRTFANNDIFMIEDQSPNTTLALTNHEILHAVTPKLVTFSEEEITPIEHRLVGTRNDSGMADEAIREMTNLELVFNHWQDQLSLRKLVGGGNVGYLENIIVFDDLIGNIAERQGITYQEVLRPLQKGLVMADKKELAVLTDAISPDGMKTLVEWKAYNPKQATQDALQVAEALGLSEAKRKLVAHAKEEEIPLMEELLGGALIVGDD